MIDPTKHRQLEELDTVNLCTQIFTNARNELYLNMHYLDLALSSFGFEADPTLSSVATDGFVIYYRPEWVFAMYKRGRVHINRVFLHMVFHCLFCHLDTRGKRAKDYWNLACDIAMESVIDGLYKKCVHVPPSPYRRELYLRLGKQMPVLTAEGIYRHLLRLDLPEYELARLQRTFLVDDHGLWDPDQQDQEQQKQREQKWQGVSEKTQTGLETVLAGKATGGEAVLEQIQVANRDDVDYRTFLRRFAVPREVMAVDGDAFDYIFYTYGLQLYGNMPLVEPPETKEEKRIEDFVIAVDTSMSTSGELVRQFLACTYAILRSTETFTRKVNIRILQCDDQVRSDTPIRDLEELKAYMENFSLMGGSATDFRPVFDHVAKLQAEGAFTSLRGLVYFTDGMGIYPQKRPPYDTAFVLLEEPPLSVKMPPWAIRLVVPTPALEQAAREAAEEAKAAGLDLIDLDELPQL